MGAFVDLPSSKAFEPYWRIQEKCDQYATARTTEDAKGGTLPSLAITQGYIDQCTEHLDRERQVRQALVLVVGLGGAVYLGLWLWKH
jgi:hypothetical protein